MKRVSRFFAVAAVSVAAAVIFVLLIGCKEQYRTVSIKPNFCFEGVIPEYLSINAVAGKTDRECESGTVEKKAEDFSLTVQPRTVKDGLRVTDKGIEDNIASYIVGRYTKTIEVPESELPLPPASNPEFISYTLLGVSGVSIVSDAELFGIAPGGELSQCFATDLPRAFDYHFMAFRDKTVSEYRKGLPVSEYILSRPLFAGAVCYSLRPEYVSEIKQKTPCRFTVSVTLDDGTVLEETSACYELVP